MTKGTVEIVLLILMVLNIISLNARGLRDKQKRRIVFDFYRNKCNILCLQETHSEEADEKIWKAEWGGPAFFSHGNTKARGVAMFIKKSCQVKISECTTDIAGRSLNAMLYVDEINVYISIIYAPNKDSPSFFEDVIKTCCAKCDKYIIIGDFNTALNPELDRKNNTSVNPCAAAKIRFQMAECNMVDIWRVQNPEKLRYSWYRGRTMENIQASRIDYALISQGLSDMIHDSFYLNGILSDHSAFFLGCQFRFTERGPSFWKLNTSLLADNTVKGQIKEVIHETIFETPEVDPMTRWEMVKKRVRAKFKKIAQGSSNEQKIAISQLSEYITECENKVHLLSNKELSVLNASKIDLEELMSKRIHGVMFRSKAKWAIEGEKKYEIFYELRKSKVQWKKLPLFNYSGENDHRPSCNTPRATAVLSDVI